MQEVFVHGNFFASANNPHGAGVRVFHLPPGATLHRLTFSGCFLLILIGFRRSSAVPPVPDIVEGRRKPNRTMGQQLKKVIKRRRRKEYLKRSKEREKASLAGAKKVSAARAEASATADSGSTSAKKPVAKKVPAAKKAPSSKKVPAKKIAKAKAEEEETPVAVEDSVEEIAPVSEPEPEPEVEVEPEVEAVAQAEEFEESSSAAEATEEAEAEPEEAQA